MENMIAGVHTSKVHLRCEVMSCYHMAMLPDTGGQPPEYLRVS